jgi:hypothetical protein
MGLARVLASDEGEIMPPESQGTITAAVIQAATREFAAGLDDRRNAPMEQRQAQLREFGDLVTGALNRYDAESVVDRDANRLAFQHLYDTAPLADPEGAGARVQLLTALVAAHVEAQGALRLTADRSLTLAGYLGRLGVALERNGLPLYAVPAYDRAARLYLEVDEHAARDDRLFDAARARRRAAPRSVSRVRQTLSAALVGYGYRPYRLLAWCAAQLVVAFAVIQLLPPGRSAQAAGTAPWDEKLFITVQDFINPIGVGDTEQLSRVSWIVLAAESYLGAVSSAVFFALLLRKWFRS